MSRPFYAAALLTTALLAGYHAAADTTRSQTKAAELNEIRTQIRELESKLETMRGNQGDLRSWLATVERQIGAINQAISAIEQQRREQTLALDALNRNRLQKRNELADQRRMLAQQMRTAYAAGQENMLKILLNQTQPGALGRSLSYYEYFNRARAERIADIRETLDALKATEENIRNKTAEIEALFVMRQQEFQTLEAGRRTRLKLLAKLNSDISGKEQRLSRLIEDERELQRLVKELSLASAPPDTSIASRPFSKLRGRLSLPSEGRITAKFGAPRGLGQLKWQGILIDADEGSAVHAILKGRVVFADWLRGLGLLIIVDHGDGFMSLYGHNQSLYKNVGDQVRQGETIAAVGNSGGQSDAGLYFEIRHRGTPVNPLLWCKAPAGR